MKALEILKAQKAEIEKMDIGSLKTKLLQETIKDLVEINEAIAELEALQQPKSCDGCINLEDIGKSYKHCKELSMNISHSTESTFCCNRYEPKEQ